MLYLSTRVEFKNGKERSDWMALSKLGGPLVFNVDMPHLVCTVLGSRTIVDTKVITIW